MSISLIDNFTINAKKPIDSRDAVANASERNTIPVVYRWDGMSVFQKDDRKTYTWNDVTQAWTSASEFSLGSGTTNSMTFWNTNTTLGSSFLYQKVISDSVGNIGINTNDPKSELQISSNSGSGVPLYLASGVNSNNISDNWLIGGTVDNIVRGSSNLYFNNGIVGIGTRAPGSGVTMIERLTISPNDFSTFGVHNINSMTPLDSTANAVVKLTSVKTNIGNSNTAYVNEFARRNVVGGANWLSYLQHNGISIDNSYLTPGTTRTFWERDPYNEIQHFGSSANYTISIDGASNRLGVNNKTPLHTIDTKGNFPNGGGPIIKMENTNAAYPTGVPTYGAGMICKNINVASPIFIGQMPHINAGDISAFTVTLTNTGTSLLSIANTGQTKLGSLRVSTSDRMVIAGDDNELFQRSIATIMQSDAYLATAVQNGLMPKINANMVTNGYYILPGGLIMQWARLTTGTRTYSFPMAFPNVCFSIQLATDRTGISDDSGSRGTNHAKSVTRTSYYAIIDASNGWMFAIGN